LELNAVIVVMKNVVAIEDTIRSREAAARSGIDIVRFVDQSLPIAFPHDRRLGPLGVKYVLLPG